MTLTYLLDVDRVKMNHRAETSRLKVILFDSYRANTDTHALLTDCSIWTTKWPVRILGDPGFIPNGIP